MGRLIIIVVNLILVISSATADASSSSAASAAASSAADTGSGDAAASASSAAAASASAQQQDSSAPANVAGSGGQEPAGIVCKDSEVLNNCPKGCVNDFCPLYPGDNGQCGTNQQTADAGAECGEPVCACRFNYKRSHDNGTCIPTRDCPPFSCVGENEEYKACPSYCPTDDCSQATPTGRCPLPGRIGIVVECKPTCRCISGYWRNNGVCVPYAECPQNIKCGANEVLVDCPNACTPVSCPTSYEAEQAQQKDCISAAVCLPAGCRCQPNYRRNGSGTCIPIGDCPGICPINQVFSNCTQALCGAQRCAELGKPVPCDTVAEGSCSSGCVCRPGTFMNEQGKCVPEKLCTKFNTGAETSKTPPSSPSSGGTCAGRKYGSWKQPPPGQKVSGGS